MIACWAILWCFLYYSFALANSNTPPQHTTRSLHARISHTPSNVSALPLPTPVALPATGNTTNHTRPSNRTHSPTPHHQHTGSLPLPNIPFPAQTMQPQPGEAGPGLDDPGSDHKPSHSHRKGPSVAQIFFEALGGVAGACVLLAVLRCLYIYKKTPSGRQSPSPEIGELDRTLAMLRNPWRPLEPPPPPPYQPPPPGYDAVMRDSGSDTDLDSPRIPRTRQDSEQV